VSAGAGRSEYFRQAPPGRTNTYPRPSTQASVPYPQDDHYDDRQDDYKDYARSGFVPRMPAMPDDDMADLAYGDVSSPRSPNGSRHQSYSSPYPPGRPEDPYPPQIPGYPRRPELPTGSSRSVSYTQDYSQSSRDIDIPYPPKPQYQSREPRHEDEDRPRDKLRDEARRTYSYDSYDRDAKVVERVPARDASDLKSSKSVRLSVDTRSGGLDAPRSPGLTARTDRLSVSGTRPDLSSNGGLPPPSPLLEAYHGTWQQLSPMPMAHRLDDDDELDNLPQLEAPKSRSSKDNSKDKLAQEVEKKKKKSVKVDDYEEDAQKISQALQKHKIDTEALSEIIPFLTHDQIMHVRREYKKLVKVQGKGVNLAKHLKTKLTGNFGKAVYVTVLGRWESEGYWANFWWQSHTSRRELLIESLMGRTNREILEIKEEFRDKRYADDLVKCMEKELKMDKFRVAVLMALEGRRQEEQDVYPQEYRNRDVETLHKALTAKQGGESVMLEVIVRRSDAHLREVMKMYDRMFGDNFPRAALKKSSNLVVSIPHSLMGVMLLIHFPGRSNSTHPQRRDQQTCPRRLASSTRHQGHRREEQRRRTTIRTPDLTISAVTLGQTAFAEGEEGVLREVQGASRG